MLAHKARIFYTSLSPSLELTFKYYAHAESLLEMHIAEVFALTGMLSTHYTRLPESVSQGHFAVIIMLILHIFVRVGTTLSIMVDPDLFTNAMITYCGPKTSMVNKLMGSLASKSRSGNVYLEVVVYGVVKE